jgi:hypothetical protein
MEKLIMEFKGHSEIDKEDLVLERIEGTDMVRVDTQDLELEDILKGVDNGEYYVNFIKTYKNTLDGEIEIELTEE